MEDTTTTEFVETAGTGASIHEGMAVDSDGNALSEEQIQALPVPTTDEAEVQTEDNSTMSKVESKEVDKDLLDWAQKKGLDPNDPIKALQIARDQERQYHENQQKQSELKRSLEQVQAYPQPQYQPPVQQPQFIGYDEQGQPMYNNVYQPPAPYVPVAPTIDPKTAFLEFRLDHKDYEVGSELDQELGKIVAEDPTFWAGRLDQAYDIVKAKLSSSDVETRIETARREERERLTAKSSLSQAAPQATVQVATAVIRTPQDAERFMDTATKDEYNARLPELQSALGIELRPRT